MRKVRPQFASLGDVPVRGWSARVALAEAKRSADAARCSDPETLAGAAYLRALREETRLNRVVGDAEEKLAKLQSNLAAAKARTGRLDDLAYVSGDVRADALRVQAQIVGLPPLIDRAAREVMAAHEALAAHRATMAEANAVSAAVEPVELEAEPVEEPARGRGRPRKAA